MHRCSCMSNWKVSDAHPVLAENTHPFENPAVLAEKSHPLRLGPDRTSNGSAWDNHATENSREHRAG
jgi:hypothetical protein